MAVQLTWTVNPGLNTRQARWQSVFFGCEKFNSHVDMRDGMVDR